jgi:hypothetical protein
MPKKGYPICNRTKFRKTWKLMFIRTKFCIPTGMEGSGMVFHVALNSKEKATTGEEI